MTEEPLCRCGDGPTPGDFTCSTCIMLDRQSLEARIAELEEENKESKVRLLQTLATLTNREVENARLREKVSSALGEVVPVAINEVAGVARARIAELEEENKELQRGRQAASREITRLREHRDYLQRLVRNLAGAPEDKVRELLLAEAGKALWEAKP